MTVLMLLGAFQDWGLAALLDPTSLRVYPCAPLDLAWLSTNTPRARATLGQPGLLRASVDSVPITSVSTLPPPPSTTGEPWSTAKLTDQNPGTFLTLANSSSLLIDLGQTTWVHRVFAMGTKQALQFWPASYENRTNPPLGLIVAYVGNTVTTTNRVAHWTVPYDAGNPVETELDVRFSPVAGRYVRLELQTSVTWGLNYWPGYAIESQPAARIVDWSVGEVEIYGFPSTPGELNENAVVLPAGAAAPLALAAGELSYYLGELTGKAHPIVTPSQTNLLPGTLYRIVDLKPLAPDYPTMTNNIAAGLLPDGVNVEISGREVLFRAWPYRCVLWSVWEFLERQGVRWLYPEAHGDFVPRGQGVSHSMLPLRFTPSARSIYANWDATAFQPWPAWMKQSVRQSFLYPWRNRWNSSWGGTGPLGGGEVPALARPQIALDADYSEKFDGYPHNFSSVIPPRILQQHTNWWGYSATAGARVSPYSNGAPAFCMSDPEAISWVARKMVEVARAYPLPSTAPLSIRHPQWAFNLLPNDAATYCQCSRCLAVNGAWEPNPVPWVKLFSGSFSDNYYHFVNSVAREVRQAGSEAPVGALAYADVFLPPADIPSLESNVQVEVCLYGAPNLSMDSPRNAAMKDALDSWQARGVRLAHYDYALLHTDYWQTNATLPVPLVSASVDRARYLARVGALDGGSQATPESLPYNPWNFYAYPRSRWNTNQSADQLMQDFFQGYYREAAVPMLAYYRALEDHLMTNQVSLYYRGYCYGITPASFPLHVLASMRTNLLLAEQKATNWMAAARVSKVRQGYDWVISQRGLAGTDLADWSRFPQLSRDNPFIVDLGRMTVLPSGPHAYWKPARREWEFLAQATISSTLNVLQGGAYEVTVKARAVPADGVFPVLGVYLGPALGKATITSTNYSDYVFTLTTPSAAWDLVLDYQNAATGGRRNIMITNITVSPKP